MNVELHVQASGGFDILLDIARHFCTADAQRQPARMARRGDVDGAMMKIKLEMGQNGRRNVSKKD